MLSCVPFKEVSQADASCNSGAHETLTKVDTVNSSSFPRQAKWGLERLRRWVKSHILSYVSIWKLALFFCPSLWFCPSLYGRVNPQTGVFCFYGPQPLTAMVTGSVTSRSCPWKVRKSKSLHPCPTSWNLMVWQTDEILEVPRLALPDRQSDWFPEDKFMGQNHGHLRNATISGKNKSLCSILWYDHIIFLL